MSVIGAIQQAMQGLKKAGDMVEKAADDIAKMPVKGDTDLPQDIVTLSLAKHTQSANVSVIKNAKEMEETTIDIVV